MDQNWANDQSSWLLRWGSMWSPLRSSPTINPTPSYLLTTCYSVPQKFDPLFLEVVIWIGNIASTCTTRMKWKWTFFFSWERVGSLFTWILYWSVLSSLSLLSAHCLLTMLRSWSSKPHTYSPAAAGLCWSEKLMYWFGCVAPVKWKDR